VSNFNLWIGGADVRRELFRMIQSDLGQFDHGSLKRTGSKERFVYA